MKGKKGFVHFIEVSFAILIFTISILASLSSVDIKTPYSSHELATTGLSILKTAENAGIMGKLFSSPEEFKTEVEKLVPSNLYYGIDVEGSPKSLIKIGCANCSGRAYLILKKLLSPVYYNKRWVNFSVKVFDFTDVSQGEDFDTLVFINFTDFDSNALVQEYLSSGGKIVAITEIDAGAFPSMDETFSLLSAAGSASYANFSFYPHESKIPKYFIAAGFYVEASATVDGKKNGKWKIWGGEKDVNITPALKAEIEDVGTLSEGDVFCLNSKNENPSLPDETFCFKLRKVFPDFLYIQPLNSSFVFLDFSSGIKVRGREERRAYFLLPPKNIRFSSRIPQPIELCGFLIFLNQANTKLF